MSIKVTFQGKPFDPEGFKDALMKQVIEKAVESVKAKASSVLSVDEQNQISVNVSEKEDGKMSVNFSGPEEIVHKIKEAFQQQESKNEAEG